MSTHRCPNGNVDFALNPMVSCKRLYSIVRCQLSKNWANCSLHVSKCAKMHLFTPPKQLITTEITSYSEKGVVKLKCALEKRRAFSYEIMFFAIWFWPKVPLHQKWHKGSIGSEDEIFFLGYSSFALDFEPEKSRSKRFLKTANFYILQFMVLLSLTLHGHFRFINVASFFKNRCSRWEVIVSVAPTTCLQSIKTSIWVRLMIVIGFDRAQLESLCIFGAHGVWRPWFLRNFLKKWLKPFLSNVKHSKEPFGGKNSVVAQF